jgi:hypothetical protein
MGVRPPSDDVDDDPDVVEFGIAALDARLEDADVAFPATKSELEERFGHTDVPYDAAGHSMGFSDALARTDRERFETEQDLLNALHPVFENKRQAASNSLLSQLRALVPF